MTIAQIGVSPVKELELTAFFRGLDINAGRCESEGVLHTQLGIDDVERLLAPLETLFDERKQHPVFLVGAVEERADMTFRVKHRAREPNRLAAFTRSSPAGLHTVFGGIHWSSPSGRRPPR